jgi:hypothetical protein
MKTVLYVDADLENVPVTFPYFLKIWAGIGISCVFSRDGARMTHIGGE